VIEYYAQVKLVHIATVIASGSLFLLRGLLAFHWRALAMAAPVRYLSYCIDTVLLTAALMLVTMLPSAMFANGWLWVKLLLLPLYIALGCFALKAGHSKRLRAVYLLAAVALFGFMLGVAHSHHPLGVLRYKIY
jgi:uncharacterized membrane protein SirB2